LDAGIEGDVWVQILVERVAPLMLILCFPVVAQKAFLPP